MKTVKSSQPSEIQIRTAMLEAAEAAAKETLPLFRSPLTVDNKLESGFDPVTKADRDTEKVIREVLASHFPEHSIFGEELENKETDSSFSWIIDPIDGTRAYISGLPVWGTLIGLTNSNSAIAGLMSQPFTGEIFMSVGGKSEYIREGKSSPLVARNTTQLANALLYTTTPELFTTKPERAAYEAVEGKVRLARYGCDCYAYALLAMGQIDLVIEAGLNSYDIAALIPIIENAGGVISTWDGKGAEDGGSVIAAATPQLRDAALEIMNEHL